MKKRKNEKDRKSYDVTSKATNRSLSLSALGCQWNILQAYNAPTIQVYKNRNKQLNVVVSCVSCVNTCGHKAVHICARRARAQTSINHRRFCFGHQLNHHYMYCAAMVAWTATTARAVMSTMLPAIANHSPWPMPYRAPQPTERHQNENKWSGVKTVLAPVSLVSNVFSSAGQSMQPCRGILHSQRRHCCAYMRVRDLFIFFFFASVFIDIKIMYVCVYYIDVRQGQ